MFIQGHRFTGKLELVQSLCWKKCMKQLKCSCWMNMWGRWLWRSPVSIANMDHWGFALLVLSTETDQQNPKRLARDGPQLESKVAGTPTALTSPVKRTSSSSSSSNTSSLTHIKPSNQEQRNKATDTVPNAVVRGKDQDKSSKSVRHASSPKFVSGKKTVTPVVSKYNDQRSKLDRASGAGETTSVSEMTVTMNPTSAAVPSTSIPQSTVTDTPVSTSSEPQEMVSGSADKKLKLRSGDTVGGIRLEGFRKSDERPVLCTDVSESTSQSYDVSSGQLQLGLSEDHPDHRQQAQVQAIETVVATDTKSKDDPQLLKIKKLDSPRAEEVSLCVCVSVCVCVCVCVHMCVCVCVCVYVCVCDPHEQHKNLCYDVCFLSLAGWLFCVAKL